MHRILRPSVLLLVALGATLVLLGVGSGSAPVAQAGARLDLTSVPVLDTDLVAKPGTFKAACHAALRTGAPGVATQALNAGEGVALVEAKLAGTEGDWDLAVFDGSGRAVAADASPDAQEVASGWTREGGVLTIQACRRSGDARSVPALVGITGVKDDPAAVAKAKAAAPELVSVSTPTREAKDRLDTLGLDLSEHGGERSVGVVLHGEQDEATLRKAGFEWEVKVPDLVAEDLAERRIEARSAPALRAGAALPSGRGSYRVLADYNAELKQLAEANPTLVKLITLPFKTGLGKDVMGVEITTNVQANDGKPVFFNMGVHHSREWPAGELTMEWALELVNGYKAGDARARKVVEGSRNIVVPIVNPDGFDASRTAGALGQPNDPDGGRDESVDDTAYIVGGASTGGEYRRKNCRVGATDQVNCTTSAGLVENGVDPNRNYGGFWGGPGADADNVASQTYRGPGPFSEPESNNIRAVVSRSQVMSLITNHTTAALFLRAPGLASLGDPVDENRGYKALGDAVAKETGYFSQKSFELYDTTGTTEDWAYNATGAYGFTNEIYCGAPNYATGDCDDPAFHPRYARVVEEWNGDNDTANHTNDPTGRYDGKGNREGFYLAAESAMNESRHSVIEGTAPAGTTLRLKKEFKTATFPQPQADGSPDKPILFDDKLETVYDVGASGKFRWHINPSTRPVVAKATGDANGGTPSPPAQQAGGPAVGQTPNDPVQDGAAPNPSASDSSLNYNDHPFTIPAGGDNRSANVRVSWPTPASDWDIELFEDLDGNGRSGPGDKSVGVSANGATSEEEVGIAGTPKLTPGKKYVLKVANFAAGEPYTVDIDYNGPEPFKPAEVESYTLTCERGGRVISASRLTIDRGQVQSTLEPCAATSKSEPTACASTAGFSAAKVTRRGRGANLAFTRRTKQPATIQVFQVSKGRRVLRERLVASFSNRTATVRWNGRANRRGARVTDGYFFVRYRTKTAKGVDTRRVVLRRSRGRFSTRSDFYRRGSCDLLPSYKLERPVFGGSERRSLGVSYRLARAARATVTVSRGSKVIERFPVRAVAAKRTIRLRLAAKGLRRGDYRVRLSAREGSAPALTSTLVSRKL